MDFDTELAKFTPRQLSAIGAIDDPELKYLLYGGALGGGKSYLLRWGGIRQLMYIASEYKIRNPVGMLACEDYPALKSRQIEKISIEMESKGIGRIHNDHKIYGRCFILNSRFGGGVLALRNLDDPSKYQSSEFVFTFVDELTKNELTVFDNLRSRLRYPGVPDFDCIFMGATNPGGIGHGWCKAFWIDRLFPDEWKGMESMFKYIPSKAKDNPHLDSSYYRILDTLNEQLRKAFRDGNWDVFVGQAFTEFNKDVHVLPNDTPIPHNAPIYCTFDWGFGKPFSVGWWFVDNDGRVIRFDEWYGWSGTPDMGLRLSDTKIAEGIKEREEQYKVGGKKREIIRYGGHDMFNKKPDYKGGGQGKSTAEVFTEHGLYFNSGDASRHLKIRQFRERLLTRSDGRPMLYIFERCKQFLRTIPMLIMDKTLEDVDTNGEDHIYDEACHICMARPIKPEDPKTVKSMVDKRLDDLEKPNIDQYEQYEREVMSGDMGIIH